MMSTVVILVIVEETYLCESCLLGVGRSFLKSLLPSTHLRGKFKKQDQKTNQMTVH